jgi:hypothetical protein
MIGGLRRFLAESHLTRRLLTFGVFDISQGEVVADAIPELVLHAER